jgi:hypothetical protein
MEFWQQFTDNQPEISKSISLAKKVGLSVGAAINFIQKVAPSVYEGVKLVTMASNPAYLPFVLLDFALKAGEAVTAVHDALCKESNQIEKSPPKP